ncbi:MAG: HAD hydrolase family protein [Erysipelotrichaceae bacterium]|nr:HAD hydrolase family protein [Erysipelotrichaceae bacterium]
MTIRLLSYDCDGTAYLNPRHEIPPSTMKALRMLKKRNVRLLLNTGRAVREMEKLPKEFLDLADEVIRGSCDCVPLGRYRGTVLSDTSGCAGERPLFLTVPDASAGAGMAG